MNANAPLATDVQQGRRRKRKAILAGGLVLGLGVAATLAAWSDDVFANGTFNTGSFELQAALDGEDFQDYDGPGEDGSATLSFQLEALKMAPSQTVYAPLTIGTETGTSLDGEFTLSGVTSAGDYAGVLTYQIYSGADAHGDSCNPTDAAAGLTAWTGGANAPVDAVAGTNTPLVVLADNDDPYQHLCFAVTMGTAGGDVAANQDAVEAAATAGTGAETTVQWVFNGQSTDEV
ncbi:hypothetical protein G6031_05015 [Dietzia sp. CQ4]|uniref:SipW-dependent-type signal peptide-containing protein n=1 Tax=Dietzia sp. (strain CQ4) TaxID=370437 RepID=UPI0015F795E4|nr:SipW-dependent-type signal peptide-containing protein [Dietzia sp. CQ4]MBB1033745.1 hypothetical protein [Dietzia sp. CQ4]